MSYPKRDTTHKGFSLMELLIVIFIISLVYYLGFSGVELGKQKPKALTPLNLKETIMHSKPPSQNSTLLCVDKCKTCYLRNGLSSPFKNYENKINLKDIKVYTLDESDSLVQIEYERFHDKKICLVIDFYSNGSSTQLILEDDKSAYFLPAFFGQTKKFSSAEDAKEYWIEKNRVVSNSGDFY